MLRLHFAPEFSVTPWVSLVSSNSTATAGIAAVGPDGLLDQLELRLGLPAPPSPAIREARLAGELRRIEGAWSDSARMSPFATARTLLRHADTLRIYGVPLTVLPLRWRRWLSLAYEAPGAVSDRVAQILPRLPRLSTRGEIVLHGEVSRVPPAVRALLDALTSASWSLRSAPNPAPVPTARVRVLQAASPRALATLLVDHLAPIAGSETTLVVGADAVLDRALQRRGLPTLGATRDDHPARALLAHLFALAFAPQDPQDALDLLSMPFQPVPAALAASLRSALDQWPSTRSPAWRAAFAAYDAAASPPPDSLPSAALATLFVPEVGAGESTSLPALRHRWLPVRRWLSALADNATHPNTRLAVEVRAQGDSLLEVIDALGDVAIHRQTLNHALAFVDESWRSSPVAPPHAGTFTAPSLGDVRAPAQHLVCWNLPARTARDPFAFLLPSERASLLAGGIALPEPVSAARAAVDDAWTAFSFIEETVWLCLSDRDDRGEIRAPDPTLPVLEARWRERTGEGFVATDPSTLTDVMPLPPRPPPRARRRWTLPPTALQPRKVESPSSVAAAIGCSLRHTLQYQGRLRDPVAPSLATGGLLFGRVAHEILASSLTSPSGATDVTAGDRARQCFDETIAERASSLDLPAASARRHLLRERIAATAVAVENLLHASQRTVLSQEQEHAPLAPFGPVRLRGTPDLVLGPTPIVLDFKWSLGSHRAALADGTAAQLALYAWMLHGRADVTADGHWPAAGYVIVTTASMHVSADAALPLAEPVAGPTMADVAAGVLASLDAHSASVARGELTAAGVHDGDEPVRFDALKDGRLSLRSPCWECAYEGLCGRALTPGVTR